MTPPGETLVVEVDRPAGYGWRDAHARSPHHFARELRTALTTETHEGTIVRGCVYIGVRRVVTLVEAWHDGHQWRFDADTATEATR